MLFLLIPVFVGVAILVSANKDRMRNQRRAHGYVGQRYSIPGSTPRASGVTVQLSLGDFSGPLVSVSKRRKRKVYVPEAYFLSATLNDTTHRLTMLHRSSTDALNLSWGTGPHLSFALPQTASGSFTTGDLLLELYGCRKGSITGKIKKVVLLGHARVNLADCLDGESRTLAAQFRVSEGGERCSRKRVVVAPGGTEIGQMGVGVRLLYPPGYVLGGARAQESAQYAYDPLKMNRIEGVSAEGYVPAAVYGPDGAAWVVASKEGEAVGKEEEKAQVYPLL
ncbi:hypothetical protein KFL_000760180 [Klebsormidium nitens]|uniref:Uncharacterized protein n=1 Tax=Klebsormidium nitens TaxID=105231 RepID=A0A1Y1HVR6_KLENI|nr:hypothetical protein KFL_000760180 [Klebsormidium nitens]|eukprot:GAQ81289.1 hypothetical protein KFL_000760180 [Klebsormidium nitens]